LGGVQWLVLRSPLSLSRWWILATAIGMAAGLAIGTAFLGSDTVGSPLLWRAAITGLCIGIGARSASPRSTSRTTRSRR
jgi:hypothetical protein